LLHFTNSDLPFGGVGASGLGSYHGKRTFDTRARRRQAVDSHRCTSSLPALRWSQCSYS
jgi:acyl-CoA reductase-like NAD-dependent aldehyde dehydrogenase